MSTFEITQSVNWYKSNVMTMNKRGNLIAYCSRTMIVLVKGLEGNSVYDLQYNRLSLNIKIACGRICAVSFSNQIDTHEDAHYLACIDEVNIYIWKVNNLVCEHIHSFGNKKNKAINLLDIVWLYECLTVVAVSETGTLHKWDIQALTMRNYTLDVKLSPLTLAACPHKKNLIAIGCKNGNIIVYDLTGDGRVLHKLHYHERNVVSLAWCPVPYNPLISDHSTQPLLLASTACDRTGLFICRAGLDMFGEVTVSLPTKPLRKTIYKNKTNLIWSSIKWIKPTMIIVTSLFGEILKVEWKSENNYTAKVSLISDSHKDIIFSLAYAPESAKPYLWSSCMGRKLIRTPLFDNAEPEQSSLEVPTLSGFVYCFSLSPVNSADFAFGLGDGRIYYWNVSNKRQLELIALSYTIDSKVLSLAFHPQNEGLLAFGTGDGRVGIFNLTKKKNNVHLLKTVLAHPIYRLCWAPPPNTKKDGDAKLALYAVGNGKILMYNDMSLWKDPQNLKEYVQFNEIEDTLTMAVKRVEMTWKPDYSVVAIGNSNGSIYLLDGDTLKLKHVVQGHEQSIECITWHPTHVTCDYSEESKYKNYFASSSHCIRVHKLNEDGKPLLVVEFKGHKEKINELAWSPHHNLTLLSCSNDFTAKVWDVQKCTLIGVYTKHVSTVLCGMFSPLDPDIIFTGSADHSVHSWRMSKDLHNEIVNFKKNQDTPSIVKEKIDTNVSDKLKIGNADSSKTQTVKIQQFPLSSYELSIGKYLEKSVDEFINSNYEKTILTGDEEINYLAFFGTTEKMKKLLAEEYHVLQKRKSPMTLINNINMWGQNLESYFKDAIQTKTIDDWMIAVAPSVSYELWTEMCDVYAGQLEDVGEVTKASTYLVAIKKFKEAAMMLLKNNLFREALAIVKSQEKHDDEIILKIMKKWAEYYNCHGHPKEAAHCYLSIGDPRSAISCLVKVKLAKELSLAAKLAKYIDEDMEKSLVINVLNMEYFKNHKWNEAREFLKNHPNLNFLNMWIGVHEAMYDINSKVTQNMVTNWICATKLEDNLTIFDYILKHVENKPEYYEKLSKTLEAEFISDTALLLPKIIVFVAGQFCLIALQYKITGLITIDSQKRLIKCFAVAYDYETVYTDSQSKFSKLLSKFIMWIFPKGPLALDLFDNFESDDNLMKTIRAYLCYTCFSWLKPLYTSLNKKICLPDEKNDSDKKQIKNKPFDQMITLTFQFQQLYQNYIHDLMDYETSNYFKAKKEIDRINHLLTGSSTINIKDTINETFNKSDDSVAECKNVTESNDDILDSKIELTSITNETDVQLLAENIKNCTIVNNTNCTVLCTSDKQEELDYGSNLHEDIKTTLNQNGDIVCTNGLTEKSQNYENKNIDESQMKSRCKTAVQQLYQSLKLELEKNNCFLSDSNTVKHVAHLEIEASKKKELENIVMEFESKRINSPDPLSFSTELKTFIQLGFDQL